MMNDPRFRVFFLDMNDIYHMADDETQETYCKTIEQALRVLPILQRIFDLTQKYAPVAENYKAWVIISPIGILAYSEYATLINVDAAWEHVESQWVKPGTFNV